MTVNAELAASTLGHLEGLGVKHVVVCAGARNAPLVVPLLSVEDSNPLRVWNHFDERSASFFALGLARRRKEPVAVITTSGTAVAEMLPAAIEAYYSGIPLILVSADRPSSFRGSGGPQAIEQKGIFGCYAPVSIDVQELTDLSWVLKWNGQEPLHLNVCFEEPSPEDRFGKWDPVELPPARPEHAHDEDLSLEAFVANCRGLVVLLGEIPENWRDRVESFLVDLKAPVWAEATSGLRESGPLADLLIRTEREVSSFRPREILRIGGVPSLRFWRDLETHREMEVMSVTRRPFSGLARRSRNLIVADFPDMSAWEGGFSHREGIPDDWAGEGRRLRNLIQGEPGSEVAMVSALSGLIPPEALVFLGNSLPIREWNLAATLETPHPHCHANRGANGIDGEVAAFLGMSEGREESWGIFGDLTALYDLNAPALLEQLSRGKRRIVVLNNGGGRIFSRLASLSDLAPAQKSVTENRHDRRFSAWAEMWGVEYRAWHAGDDAPDLPDASVILEVLPDEASTEAFWKEWK